MKQIIFLLSLSIAFSSIAYAKKYKCTIKDGSYKTNSSETLSGAFEKNTTFKGETFTVDSETGYISGPALVSNSGKQVAILKEQKEKFDNLVVISKGRNDSLQVLKVMNHDGKRTFTLYIASLNMLFSGPCK